MLNASTVQPCTSWHHQVWLLSMQFTKRVQRGMTNAFSYYELEPIAAWRALCHAVRVGLKGTREHQASPAIDDLGTGRLVVKETPNP